MQNRQFSLFSLLVSIFGIIALGITIFAITQSTEFRIKAAKSAVLQISGSPETAVKGQTVDLVLDVDTNSVPIQTAYINLVYPIDKAEFLQLDTHNSPFDQDAGTFEREGYISLARATASPTSGIVHVAVLHFKAKEPMVLSDIKPVTGTSILGTKNENVYKQTYSYVSPTPTVKRSLFNIQFFFLVFENLLKGKRGE